jgi:phosphoenolpyruvate carboxylase
MAEPEIMRLYAGMVEDAAVRERVFTQVQAEYERTRQLLEVLYGGSLDQRRPNVHALVEVRRAPLHRLHEQQIAMLRRWRALRQAKQEQEAAALLPHLLLTVNALASGLGSTG